MTRWTRVCGTIAVAALTLAACARPAPSTPPAPPRASTSAARFSPTKLTTIAVSGEPFGIAVTPDSRWVLVALDGPQPKLAVLTPGGDGLRPVRTIALPLRSATGVGLSTDGKRLLVTDWSSGQVAVVDVARATAGQAHAVIGEVKVGAGAIEAAVTRSGRYAFVSDEDRAELSVLKLTGSTPSVVGTIPVDEGPVGLALSPDGRWLYATSEVAKAASPLSGADGTLTVIDVARAERDPAKAVVARVPAGRSPVRVVVSPDGRVVWVTARGQNDVLAFDAARLRTDPTHALLAQVPVGSAPVGIALTDGGKLAVVADSNRFQSGSTPSTLTIIDTQAALAKGKAVVATLPAGSFPREVAVAPNGETVYVSDYRSDQLTVVPAAALRGGKANG